MKYEKIEMPQRTEGDWYDDIRRNEYFRKLELYSDRKKEQNRLKDLYTLQEMTLVSNTLTEYERLKLLVQIEQIKINYRMKTTDEYHHPYQDE